MTASTHYRPILMADFTISGMTCPRNRDLAAMKQHFREHKPLALQDDELERELGLSNFSQVCPRCRARIPDENLRGSLTKSLGTFTVDACGVCAECGVISPMFMRLRAHNGVAYVHRHTKNGWDCQPVGQYRKRPGIWQTVKAKLDQIVNEL